MRKIDKHFSLSPDLDNKIKISLKKSKRSYSDELNFIINEYFKEKEELEKILISLDSDMKFVARKMNILFELVKQIYSDMDNYGLPYHPLTSLSGQESLRQRNK